MSNDLAQKLTKLANRPGLALLRWTSSTKRVAGMYIPLPELRLNILTSNNGVVHLSVAAPVLVYTHGRPDIRFYDDDLMLVTEGCRKGINLPASFLKEGEKAVKLKGLVHMNVTDDCPPTLEKKVMDMGNADKYYPQIRVLIPDTFRITRRPESIRPLYTADMLKAIGGLKSDSPEQLHAKFMDNIELFCEHTEDGYVFPNSLIATGGMPCVRTTGIPRSSGSDMIKIPLAVLEDDIKQKNWQIHLNEHMEGDA